MFSCYVAVECVLLLYRMFSLATQNVSSYYRECVLLLYRMCSLTTQNVFSFVWSHFVHHHRILSLHRTCSPTIQNVFSYHIEGVLFGVQPLCGPPAHSADHGGGVNVSQELWRRRQVLQRQRGGRVTSGVARDI